MYYQFNEPHVIRESMDEESVVIHLGTGCYYSMNAIATTIMNLIHSGYSVHEIGEQLSKHYATSIDAQIQSTQTFVDRLIQEDILVPQENTSLNRCEQSIDFPQNFTTPDYEKFTNMQEMLLLDPIHDVTPKGWPHQK